MAFIDRRVMLGLTAAVLLLGGCREEQQATAPAVQGQGDASESPADALDLAAMQGEWLIVGDDGEELGDTVVISDAVAYEWKKPNGMRVSVVFDPAASSESGVVMLTFENAEDSEAMGGGGPRKAFARRTDNGDVEIIVALSAGHDYPMDDAEGMPELRLRRK